jgi:tricarballylate dehydrogenase
VLAQTQRLVLQLQSALETRSVIDRAVGIIMSRSGDTDHEIEAHSVVLAAGGFEADPDRRRLHLGDGWEDALVRGTPTNTGEVLDIAIASGAAKSGQWSGCHSVAWDAGAPAAGGERRLTNQLTRQSYPLGIVVNTHGQRFIDEGADFRNFTYAKYGREILAQPGGRAFQLFDARTRPLLRTEEYDSEPITMATAGTIEALADARHDGDGLVKRWPSSTCDVPLDPAVKDGQAACRAAEVELGPGPRLAAVLRLRWRGITFTFGGLQVDELARVVGTNGELALASTLRAKWSADFYTTTPAALASHPAPSGRIAGDHAARLRVILGELTHGSSLFRS